MVNDIKSTEDLKQRIKELDNVPENREFKTERTQILFKKSTKTALKKIARVQTKGSLNELVNLICDDYIKSLGL